MIVTFYFILPCALFASCVCTVCAYGCSPPRTTKPSRNNAIFSYKYHLATGGTTIPVIRVREAQRLLNVLRTFAAQFYCSGKVLVLSLAAFRGSGFSLACHSFCTITTNFDPYLPSLPSIPIPTGDLGRQWFIHGAEICLVGNPKQWSCRSRLLVHHEFR